MIRLGLIGYGAVAVTHAAQLRLGGASLAVVCGPDRGKAAAFAAAHGFAHATTEISEALSRVDAVVVASPSPCHYEQTLRSLQARISVLVEVPACASATEARQLGAEAARANVALQCAHTARYLEPFVRLRDLIASGRLGEILQVNYFRSVRLSARSWSDDALLHHMAHPADLLLHWFGPLHPAACVGLPAKGNVREVSLLAQLPGGGPATLAVSYAGNSPGIRMSIVGSRHTVVTDGFSDD